MTEDSNYAGPQQFNTVSYYGTELARGLAYLAKEGIVHGKLRLIWDRCVVTDVNQLF